MKKILLLSVLGAIAAINTPAVADRYYNDGCTSCGRCCGCDGLPYGSGDCSKGVGGHVICTGRDTSCGWCNNWRA